MSSKYVTVAATCFRFAATGLLACGLSMGLCANAFAAGTTKSAPKPASAPVKSAPAKSAPAKSNSPSSAGHTASNNSSGTKPGSTAKPGGASANKPAVTRDTHGNTTTRTASGKEVTKSASGKVTSVKTASGNEAKFGSNGKVKEIHTANGMTVSHGPAGMRRVEVERPDHSRLVAEGHGRGYIQRPYNYGGHAYYSRAYYYHGGYYRGYYRGYYYHGGYYNAYMPAYYYPPAYYGWAYNPWPAPVPYAWGWAGNPWYGYYGAYFAPYPVYPSPAYWLTDYMVSASLADAYADAAASGDAAMLRAPSAPHLVFASYDPSTGVTSPTLTPEVKDAISEEIKNELSAQKAKAGTDANVASLDTLLADGKPHVFVASAALTVTSGGQDCGITRGDVLKLPAAPGADATTADLQVMASKKSDCAKDSTVSVQVSDLQEMYNSLLASIDKGMGEMKDNGAKGGLPAPPAEATAGTTQAPYAAAAPPVDPDGAAQLDQQAAQGAQVEQQVVAEVNTPDGGEQPAVAESVQGPAASARPTGPITISLGQTPAQVVAGKGEPITKLNFPNKMIYKYPDMKVIFVNGKVSDVE